MSATADLLAYVVGYGAHVGSGSHAGAKTGPIAIQSQDLEFLDFYLHRLQGHILVLARQLVGGDPLNFLGGKWRRESSESAPHKGPPPPSFFPHYLNILLHTHQSSASVIHAAGPH